MKAISEIISTIIIMGTIIAISLTIFYYSMYILSDSIVSTEFGYDKSIILNIASNTNLFLQGNSYVATIPGQYVGIGYVYHKNSIYINLTINNLYEETINIDTNISSLILSAPKAFVTEYKIVYGLNNNNTCPFIVDNIKYLPCVKEYFSNGKSYVELDYMRIYKTVYLVGAGTPNERYLVRLIYIDLVPILLSSSPRRIIVTPSGEIYSQTFNDVTDLQIILFNNSTNTITTAINLDDIIPNRNPAIPVDVTIVINRLNVVLG